MSVHPSSPPRPEVIDLVYEIQREFSRQTEPAGLVRVFLDELSRLLPVSRLLYVMPWPPPIRRYAAAPVGSLSTGSLGYRVLLDVDASCVSATEPSAFRRMFQPRSDDLPDGRGGLLGEITGQPLPILRGDLSLSGGACGLGPAAANHRSMMAVPVFWQGHVQGWIVVFSDQPDAFSRDDLRLLLTTGNTLVRSTVYLDALEETRCANARVHETLAHIGQVQRSMLAATPPPDPRVRYALAYETCEESGGDHYDVHEPAPGLVELVIADVSGHGVLATVGVAILRAAIIAQRRAGLIGPDAVREIDAVMLASMRPGAFATAWFGTLDLATGVIEYINRGHPPPVVRRAHGGIDRLDADAGIPLAVADMPGPPPARDTLAQGDLLVLFSDGITEAFNPAGEQFGNARLIEAIQRGDGCPERTKAAILRAVATHQAGRPRQDDQTLVLVSRVS